ncbi:MAG TPA: DUF1592 domain-containing protein, partial [Bryobacteraceae bacterium]
MKILRDRESALLLGTCAILTTFAGGRMRGADEPAPAAVPMFRQYCYQCHGNAAHTAGISLESLTAKVSIADNFATWEKVAAALEQNRMPPKGLPQPSDEQRHQAVAWIRGSLDAFVKKHDGDPGRVTVRRLTSGEYAYTIHDLTGLDPDLGIDASSDSVGGEGFTNFGDVQFMQDANLERYLEAAKLIADRAVIGSGPIEFFSDPGKSGFEMSAIARIKEIYTAYGFRMASGEGGFAYGLDKYRRAFYVAWRYRHRAALGEPTATLKDIAAHEGITPAFAQHIWTVMNKAGLGYPTSEMADRWRKLPAPGADLKASVTAAKAGCEDLEKFVTMWPGWLFARGDSAYGGAGDESPLILTEAAIKAQATHHFTFLAGFRGGRGRGPVTGPAKVFLNVSTVNPFPGAKPVVIWHNPTVAFRRGLPGRGAPTAAAQTAGAAQPPAPDAPPPDAPPMDGQPAFGKKGPPPGPRLPLRTLVSEEIAKKLAFGTSPDGSTIGPDDFASGSSVSFEFAMPEGAFAAEFQVDAMVGRDRDQVYRITISDRPDGFRGIPVRALLADPQSPGYRTFKAGVLELFATMPPNAQSEPTPADKDPIPEPFDSAYNVPEHDDFDTRVKYVRDDRFIYRNMIDDATRVRLDHAWNDLYASFAYHDNYLSILAEHFKFDLKGKHMADLDKAQIAAMPPEMQRYVTPLRATYLESIAAQAAARPHHVEDCLQFAARAWRRPLTEKEKQSLRSFYDKLLSEDPDHRKAIRALLTRILVSPVFLYRVEQASAAAAARPAAGLSPARPLNNWEMASRLSYFLWASIPDDELRRAAATGELSDPQQLQHQVKRMLADAKARRLSTEFFGQWLGFYHFDQFKGVDTGRYPEFTAEVKEGMYDEAVSFFEY